MLQTKFYKHYKNITNPSFYKKKLSHLCRGRNHFICPKH